MKIILLALSLALPLSAQNKSPKVRYVDKPTASQQSPSLDVNHTITLSGTLSTGDKIDLSLTGIGPDFQTDQVVGKNTTILSCTYTLTQREESYHLKYSIGARIKIETKDDDGGKTVEFRDMVLRGVIACQPDKPVHISKSGDKSLTLAISKAK